MDKGLSNLMNMANKLADNVAESVNGLNNARNSIKQHIPDEFSEEYNNLMNISNKTKKTFDGRIDANELLKELKAEESRINKKVKDASKDTKQQ